LHILRRPVFFPSSFRFQGIARVFFVFLLSFFPCFRRLSLSSRPEVHYVSNPVDSRLIVDKMCFDFCGSIHLLLSRPLESLSF